MKIKDSEIHEQVTVTYCFRLPIHKRELDTFSKAEDYEAALLDIYERCREVWRCQENPSKDCLKLANEIGDEILERGLIQ